MSRWCEDCQFGSNFADEPPCSTCVGTKKKEGFVPKHTALTDEQKFEIFTAYLDAFVDYKNNGSPEYAERLHKAGNKLKKAFIEED